MQKAHFTVTGATTVSALLNSTFWAAAPHGAAAAAAGPAGGRALQDSQFPKFGVYRVWVDGVRTEKEGLDGVVVFPGKASFTLVAGLDATVSHNITLAYTTDAVFNSWPDMDLGAGCKQSVLSISTDGLLGPAVPQRSRRMLIIGDSITSANDQYMPCSNATTCDSSTGYFSQLCEHFQANCTQLTASSKG
jgi:hypothetical protein